MRTDWRLIALLYVAGLLAAGQFAKIALVLPELADLYPGRPVAVLVSGVSVAGIVFGVTAGVVVARLGAGRTLIAALLGAAVVTAVEATLPAFSVLMGLRIAEGIFHLAIVVAAPTLMAATAAGRDVPVAMGLWGTFFGVGFALSALAHPLLGGPRFILFGHAASMVVVALALWSILPRVTPQAMVRQGFMARHVEIYRSPRVIAPALGFFAHTLVFLGLLTFLPLFVGDWTAPILPLVALLGTFGAGVLARRVAPSDITLIAFALAIVAMLVAATVDGSMQVAVVMVAMVVIGLVPGAAFADVPALNSEPAKQAQAYGAIAQLGNVGTAISAPLFAFAAASGYAGVAVVFAGISTAGLLAVWLIHRKIAEHA